MALWVLESQKHARGKAGGAPLGQAAGLGYMRYTLMTDKLVLYKTQETFDVQGSARKCVPA